MSLQYCLACGQVRFRMPEAGASMHVSACFASLNRHDVSEGSDSSKYTLSSPPGGRWGLTSTGEEYAPGQAAHVFGQLRWRVAWRTLSWQYLLISGPHGRLARPELAWAHDTRVRCTFRAFCVPCTCRWHACACACTHCVLAWCAALPVATHMWGEAAGRPICLVLDAGSQPALGSTCLRRGRHRARGV